MGLVGRGPFERSQPVTKATRRHVHLAAAFKKRTADRRGIQPENPRSTP
jgi:hypothetical protein